MKLKNILGISICVTCLSLIVSGISVFGEEQNQDISTNKTSKEDIIKKEVKKWQSKAYADYYAMLRVDRGLNEKQAEGQAIVYFREIRRKKSHDYADYCSRLLVERNIELKQARLQADIYEKERLLSNRSYDYLDYYSSLMIEKGMKEEQARKQAEIYEQEKNKNKSFDYASYYSKLIVEGKLNEEEAMAQAEIYEKEKSNYRSEYYKSYYSMLVKDRGLSEEQAKKKAEIYEKERKKGRSHYYADYYLILKERDPGRGNLETQIEIYEKEMNNGRSHDDADYYAELMSRIYLQKGERARIYDLERKAGKSHYYATCCADYYATCWSLKDSFKFGVSEQRKLKDQEIRNKAKIYEQEMNQGKMHYYADYYADLIILKGLKEEQARSQAKLYSQAISKGRDRYCADYYTTLILRGIKEEQANKLVDKYEEYMKQEIRNQTSFKSLFMTGQIRFRHVEYYYLSIGKSGLVYYDIKTEASYYARLILDRGLSEKEARKEADLMYHNIYRYNKSHFLEYYKYLRLEKGLNHNEANRISKYYESLIYEKKLTVEQARKEASNQINNN